MNSAAIVRDDILVFTRFQHFYLTSYLLSVACVAQVHDYKLIRQFQTEAVISGFVDLWQLREKDGQESNRSSIEPMKQQQQQTNTHTHTHTHTVRIPKQ